MDKTPLDYTLNLKSHCNSQLHLCAIENETQLPSSQYLLPLVMIESESQYYPPTHIEKDLKIKKYPSGLLGDTDFAKENYPGKPVFFCPAKPKYEKRMTYKNQHGSNLNKNCLFEKHFRKSKELKCSKIATPVLLKLDDVKCGPGNEGNVYEFAYEVSKVANRCRYNKK